MHGIRYHTQRGQTTCLGNSLIKQSMNQVSVAGYLHSAYSCHNNWKPSIMCVYRNTVQAIKDLMILGSVNKVFNRALALMLNHYSVT